MATYPISISTKFVHPQKIKKNRKENHFNQFNVYGCKTSYFIKLCQKCKSNAKERE